MTEFLKVARTNRDLDAADECYGGAYQRGHSIIGAWIEEGWLG